MKTIKRLTFALAFLLGIGTQVLAKKTDRQIRHVPEFNAISVSSGIDLYLTQSGIEKVEVKADQDIIHAIVTKVKNGVLHIYLEKNMNWQWSKSRQAYVTFDDLEEINAAAGSDVYSENSFKLKDLKLIASSGSDIKLEDLKADKIWLSTSSGSDAHLSGKVNQFEAKASSGSDIDARNLVSKECEVSVSSGSDASVHVTESLKASASSGGDVRYKGNPAHKDIHESSGGDVYSF